MPPDRRVDVGRASPLPRDRGHEGEAAHEVRDHVTHPHAGQHGHLARGLGWGDGVAVKDKGLPYLGDQSVRCMRGFQRLRTYMYILLSMLVMTDESGIVIQ